MSADHGPGGSGGHGFGGRGPGGRGPDGRGDPRSWPSHAPGSPLLAVGWATVELDRAATNLAPLLVPGTTFEEAAVCEHLGAWCRLGRADPGPGGGLGPFVILMEPSTEGRLAATLARHGEGWWATWETGSSRDRPTDADADAVGASIARPGPLGRERLVLGSPVSGPHRLLVEAVTIEA